MRVNLFESFTTNPKLMCNKRAGAQEWKEASRERQVYMVMVSVSHSAAV